MRGRTLAVAGAVAAGVLAVGVVVGVLSPVSSAFAQTPTPGATPGPRAERAADYVAKLAANLGVSVDALKAANQKTAIQMIDEAVTAGRLTAAQATEAKARIAAGGGAFGLGGFHHLGGRGHGGPGGPGGPRMEGNRGPGANMNAVAAAAIGIDVATLQSELRAGKSLAEIAAAHGKTREALKAALGTAQSERLDQLLDRKFTPGAPRPAASPTATPSS